ncbi:MAG: hypothetical protein J2P26_12220 [Nocardiopsaceae bacterium]|nr:hypothetical protein [Nocardiopsaceae bacterium]
MTILALGLWTLTVAAGVYLLVSSARLKGTETEAAVPLPSARKRDRFDPPSLRAAKSEPVPGLRALAEFTHPALAGIGFAFWLLYTISRDGVFGAIALGVLLGAIVAGLSWAFSNARAARKADADALAFSGRVLVFHVAGAAVTLLLAGFITLSR